MTNGLSLAKSVGAKVTVIIVEEPFSWLGVSKSKGQQSLAAHGAFEELGKQNEEIKKHAASVLNRVANAAKQAGTSCDTIQVDDVQPYQAIVATAADHFLKGNATNKLKLGRPNRARSWQRFAP